MASSPKRREPERIGYAESVDLPDWGIGGLRAKMDTGARTSALHVDSIEPLRGGWVRFDVVINRRTGRTVRVDTVVSREGSVRSSSGDAEHRYFVRTAIRLGAVEKEIEVGLTARPLMQFRMLLGRTALTHDFLIDAGSRHLTGKRPLKRVRTSRSPRSTTHRSIRRRPEDER